MEFATICVRKWDDKNIYMYLLIITKRNTWEYNFFLVNPLFFGNISKYLVKMITIGHGRKWGRRYIFSGIYSVHKIHRHFKHLVVLLISLELKFSSLKENFSYKIKEVK